VQEKEKYITPVVSTVHDDTSQTLIDTENGSLRANTPTSVPAPETLIPYQELTIHAVTPLWWELEKCAVGPILRVTMPVLFLAKVRRIFMIPKLAIRRSLTAVRKPVELPKAPSRRDNVVFLEGIFVSGKALRIL
jgi:hypothetical protein